MDDFGVLPNLRRLRLIGVLAPVVFLVSFEVVRLAVIDAAFEGPVASLVAASVGAAAAIAFGFVLFFHLERTQRRILQQNRDLTIVTAVSVAIQGELDVEAVIRAALRAVVESTGAAEARIVVHPAETGGVTAREISLVAPDAPATDALATPDRIVEIALTTGSTSVGVLRLRVPPTGMERLPSSLALQTLGQHLAAAIHIGQLVADLRRRKHEGHTLYETLLQISNQVPLPDVLQTIVEGGRDRLGADDCRVCLTEPVLRTFEADQTVASGLVRGIGCEPPDPDARTDGAGWRHRCEIGASDGYAATLHVPVWSLGELLGDLWLARRSGPAFTERDRRYLLTLAGLATIAIQAAQLREQERQGAILGERDRIARELHDSMAQVLGSTHLRLRGLIGRPDLTDRPAVVAELADLAGVADEAYRDVREAILGLREASRPRGLFESLEAYLEKYTLQSGVPAMLETGLEGEPSIPTSSEIQIIRVIQEALTNVRKHAGATAARIRVSSVGAGPEAGLMIVIEDDGRGFDTNATPVRRDGGYGLQTMRERMDLAGGTLRVDSVPGRGTRVIAILPEGARTHGNGRLADHR